MRQLNSQFVLGDFGGGDVPFRIERTYFKSLPLRYELQTPVELALRLRQEFRADEIAAIKVFMDERSLSTRENGTQSLGILMTRETADHSGPYLIGAAIVDGAISHETFTERRFRDPTILALVEPHRSGAGRFAPSAVSLADGVPLRGDAQIRRKHAFSSTRIPRDTLRTR